MGTKTAVRNIGIIAHIDAGKTTLSERLLFYGQRIHRMGEVHDGNATMDFLEEEQERGITISSACTAISWKSGRINLLDTPGHVDFSVEVERALRVCDGAVVVLCGVNGIESQSETVWRQADKYQIPKLLFLNKMDRPGADFQRVSALVAARFGCAVLPLTVPAPKDSQAVLDVITGKRVLFAPEDLGMSVREEAPAPEDLELLGQCRTQCLEYLADEDDRILAAYLADEDVDVALFEEAVRRAVLSRRAVGLFCGSALKNVGVQPLMDGVLRFLPAPEEASGTHAVQTRMQAAGMSLDQTVAFAFKVIFEGAHKRTFLRVYAGELRDGCALYNSRTQRFEKIHGLYAVHAHHFEPLERALPGDIVLVGGLKDSTTADTLCAGKQNLMLENISLLQPVLSVALVPASLKDTERLEMFLERYALEDPTLRLRVDEHTGQLLVSGLGELHLEIVLKRLQKESGLFFRYGNPQVIVLETVRQGAEETASCARMIGDKLQAATTTLEVLPLQRGRGVRIDVREVPAPLREVVEKAVTDTLQAGVVEASSVTDVLVVVHAIAPVEGMLTELGARMAVLEAMRQALCAAAPCVLEPFMRLELGMPDTYVGETVTLLGAKNARILDVLMQGDESRVLALAPMRQLFGFSTELRSRTKGRVFYSLSFAHYDVL